MDCYILIYQLIRFSFQASLPKFLISGRNIYVDGGGILLMVYVRMLDAGIGMGKCVC